MGRLGLNLITGPANAGKVALLLRRYLDALRSMAVEEVLVPEIEPVELAAIRGIERAELSFEVVGIEQARLELAEDCEKRIGEAPEAGRPAEAVEGASGERSADDQRALGLGRHPA